MKAALVLLLAGAFATSPPHDSWTLAHARHVLMHKAYDVTDTSQADRPHYEADSWFGLGSQRERKGARAR